MKHIAPVGLAVLWALTASVANAVPITYSIESALLPPTGPAPPGPPSPVFQVLNITGTFTVGPLLPNLDGLTDSPLLDYSFSDGVATYRPGTDYVVGRSRFETDATGAVTGYWIILSWDPISALHPIPTDAAFTFAAKSMSSGHHFAVAYCTLVSDAGTCIDAISPSTSQAPISGPTPVSSPDPVEVPEPATLTMLGIGLAGLLLARRRSSRT